MAEKLRFRPSTVSFQPRFHGGAPGISLQYKYKPEQPTNAETRVSPEYGFARRRHIGSTRTSMVGDPPRKRFERTSGAKVNYALDREIPEGTKAEPPNDFVSGGPVANRWRCRGRTCEMIGAASTAKPSGKLRGVYRGKMLPVGAKSLTSVSERAKRQFGPGRGRGGL